MNLQQQKKFEAVMQFNYPLLRQAGIYKPAIYGRSVIDYNEFINIFYDPASAQRVVDIALYLAGGRLQEVLGNEKFNKVERSLIINQHMDLAETYLLHHSKRFPEIYNENVEEFEAARSDYLKQAATQEDATPASWTEYAYWLLGRADKVGANDADAAAVHNKEAETYLRKAHYAGYTEATEALATLIYTSTDNVGEAVFYWEKAASTGNLIAIQNLTNVVVGDDRLMAYERIRSLSYVWQGIASNKKETKDVAASLKQAGLCVPAAPEKALVPA